MEQICALVVLVVVKHVVALLLFVCLVLERYYYRQASAKQHAQLDTIKSVPYVNHAQLDVSLAM